jgi:8-amino-7-oxononanoate synthase
LKLVREEEWRRERLQELVQRFRAGAAQLGLSLLDSGTPIQPLIVGDAGTALQFSEALRGQGILVTAIRPPTVQAGTARLRITFSATHTEAHVDRLLDALDNIFLPQRAQRTQSKER